MDSSGGLFSRSELEERERRRAAFVKAEIETSLAEKELEDWRRTRQPPEPSRDSSFQRRFADLTSLPDRFLKAENSHSDCISRTEHDRALDSLRLHHSQELDQERSRMLETLSTKIKEFEASCAEKYQAKLKSTGEAEELRTQLQAARLNEEVVRRKYEGEIALCEQTLQEYRQRLAKAEQGLGAGLKEQLEAKNAELRQMAERVKRLEAADISKGQAETEKSKRLEEDYKKLAMELTEAKLKQKREGELRKRLKEAEFLGEKMKRDHSALVKSYQRSQKKLQTLEEEKTRRTKSPLRSTTLTPRNKQRIDEATATLSQLEHKRQELAQEVQELETQRNQLMQSIRSRDWEDLRSYYETKCLQLNDEVMKWKEKTTSLVSKFYTALKKLKREAKEVRRDMEQTKTDMEAELATAVESTRTRYDLDRTRQTRTGRQLSAGRRRAKADNSFT